MLNKNSNKEKYENISFTRRRKNHCFQISLQKTSMMKHTMFDIKIKGSWNYR